MYSQIQTYVNARVTAVNALITGTDNDLSEIETGFITKENAKSESDKHYQTKITGWRIEEGENMNKRIVDVAVEFAFLISNNRDNYGTVITTYLDAFIRELVRPANAVVTASNYTVYGLPDYDGLPVVEGTNEFENEYLYPTVNFSLRIGDANA